MQLPEGSRLSVIGAAGRDSKDRLYWVRCSCGSAPFTIRLYRLRSEVLSCGCLRVEKAKETHTTHGESKPTVEYKAWKNAKALAKICGGIFRSWEESFEQFLADIGRRPSPKASLLRRDLRKGYFPGNVCWGIRNGEIVEECR